MTLIVCSISGGKDSHATALLAIKQHGRENVRLVTAHTGNEHEITEHFVRVDLPAQLGMQIDIVRADFSRDIARKRRFIERQWAKDGVPPDRIARALELLVPTGNPFLDLCMMKGRFPSRMAQFCTFFLKRMPLDAYVSALINDLSTIEVWQGVRRDESEARKDALDEEWAPEGWLIRRPIASWTAQQVVDYIQAEGGRLNPLYSQGCSRVGCMLCINAKKDEIANCARRWPRHIARLREWETLVSECSKQGWTTFFCDGAEDGETNAEIFERMKIDSRVRWARTRRGGRQYDMMALLPAPVCVSSYGLCE